MKFFNNLSLFYIIFYKMKEGILPMLSLFTLPDSTPGVILNLSIILAAGFLATRATKKIHLPNVTGYILA